MKKKNKVVKIILFIAAVIGLTYLANLIINMLATKDHKLSSSPEDFYRWKDSKVYYRKKGSGKPLLLLHNLAADSSAFEWSKVFDTLAKNHTVYVLDLPGCGRSDKEKLTYVGYYYVQLIHSFTADVIGEKTDVAATGNTASIALSACLSDNSLLDKVVMINPLSIEKQKKGRPVNAIICKYILEIPVLGTLIYNILNSRNNIDLSFTENILYNPFHADADIIDTYHAHRVGSLVRLCPQRMHSRSLGNIQHLRLDKSPVDIFSHFPAEGIDFPDKVSLAAAADVWVARHQGNALHADGKNDCIQSEACAGKSCFAARMAGADHRDIIFFCNRFVF